MDLPRVTNMDTHSSQDWHYYPQTDDFGVKITTLLTASWKEHPHLKQTLTHWAQQEGVSLLEGKTFYYPRNAKIETPSGNLLRTIKAEKKIREEAAKRGWKREQFLENNGSVAATKHPSFFGKTCSSEQSDLYYLYPPDGLTPQSRKIIEDQRETLQFQGDFMETS